MLYLGLCLVDFQESNQFKLTGGCQMQLDGSKIEKHFTYHKN
jgi:hypothetical protein